MRDRQQIPVVNSRHELAGQSILRQLRMWVRRQTTVLGCLGPGPELMKLLILAVLHWFGRPLFRIRTWLRNQHWLPAKLRSLTARAAARRSGHAGGS